MPCEDERGYPSILALYQCFEGQVALNALRIPILTKLTSEKASILIQIIQVLQIIQELYNSSNNSAIILMSKQQYITETLTLPSSLPLFNYNINFDGLKNLMEELTLKSNQTQATLSAVTTTLPTLTPLTRLTSTESLLNRSIVFTGKCDEYLQKRETYATGKVRGQVKDMGDVGQFGWKMGRVVEMLGDVLGRLESCEEKASGDQRKVQKMIDEAFKRLEGKIDSNLDSFNKTMQLFFNTSNDKTSELQSSLSTFKTATDVKLTSAMNNINQKIDLASLPSLLEASELKIRKQLQTDLKNDQMQRLSALNSYQNKLKEVQKDIELKFKVMSAKVAESSEKVNKALLTNTFEIQKHKIYQKLSQFKSKTDELFRKHNQFIDFRKIYLAQNEKTKQDIISVNEDIKKLSQTSSGFSKMESIGEMLTSLDPHLICQIGQEVKLHQKEIGNIEKQLLELTNEVKNGRGVQRAMPEVNGGQNSDLIQKIIKEFMSNMDFEGRVKRAEKDVYELKKRNDTFTELEKKIYMLSKEMDMGAINKELKKKCDEQNTRKDTKILDGKIEQLFEFYKQLRRQIQDRARRPVKQSQPYDASITTKKLISGNCLSCIQPQTHTLRPRTYSKSKNDMSVDYGLQTQRTTLYSKIHGK